MKQSNEAEAVSGNRSTNLASAAFFGSGLAYLVFKMIQLSVAPGYDFKFIWVAGRMWLRGLSPYSAGYFDFAKTLVHAGNVPDLWVYPPNWWLLAIGLGVFDLQSSAVVWNIANILMLVAASALIVGSFRKSGLRINTGFFKIDNVLNTGPTLFCIHFFVLCIFEPTAFVLSVGQTSVLIYFGIAVSSFGIVSRSRWLQAFGLAILFFKPQVGIVFVIPFLFMGRLERGALIRALLISALLCIPSIVVEPSVPIEFLNNLLNYDSFTLANHPLSMTGVRLVIFEIFGLDIGNIAATAFTLAVVISVCFVFRRRDSEDMTNNLLFPATTSIVMGLAPLHIYDLVIVGVLPLIIFNSPKLLTVSAALFGMLLMLRSENWAKLTEFYSPVIEIFPGSRIATLGAIILAAAVVYQLAVISPVASDTKP